MITKKDIARQKAKEKYAEEINKLVEKTNKDLKFHFSQIMTRFYNASLRIAERNILAFELAYQDLKEEIKNAREPKKEIL